MVPTTRVSPIAIRRHLFLSLERWCYLVQESLGWRPFCAARSIRERSVEARFQMPGNCFPAFFCGPHCLFALDLAPFRALVCISSRNGLRRLSAGLLDLVPLGAACDRPLAISNRDDHMLRRVGRGPVARQKD